jgi:hypothetical protein
MHTSILRSAIAALMVASSVPAFADCSEDIQAIELAGLQNALDNGRDPAGSTPAEMGKATYPQQVQNHLNEAEEALKAGDEQQCLRMLHDLREMLAQQ